MGNSWVSRRSAPPVSCSITRPGPTNLGFDNPPATADEFRQQACAANASFRKDKDPKNDGYGGWIVDTHWQTTYSWLLAFGGSVTDGNAYGFRTDPNLATLQFLKGLYDDHCAWLSTEPTPFDSFARRSALFVSGDLAELPLETESMSRLKNADEWTVIPFPGPQTSAVVAYGPSYTLLKSTPEKQLAAWLFARWLLSAGKPGPMGGSHRAVPAAHFAAGHGRPLPGSFPAMGRGGGRSLPGAGRAAIGLLAQGPLRAGGWDDGHFPDEYAGGSASVCIGGDGRDGGRIEMRKNE